MQKVTEKIKGADGKNEMLTVINKCKISARQRCRHNPAESHL